MPKNIRSDVLKLAEKLMQDFLFYAGGKRLPSYRMLLRRYDCSRQTLTLALQELKQKGILRTEIRSGMFIREDSKVRQKRVLFLRVDWPCPHAELFSRRIRAEFRKRNFCAYSEIRYDSENLNVFLRSLNSSIADVLVLWLEKGDVEKVSILAHLDVPVVFFDSGMMLYNADILDLQQEMFGMMAAEYLLKKGHRKTAVIVTEPFGLTCRKKVTGFLNYMRVNGVEPRLIDCQLRNGEASEAQAEDFLEEYFQNNPFDFSGCFVTNSIPLMRLLKKKGDCFEKKFCIVNGSGLLNPALLDPSANILFDIDSAVVTLVDGVEAILRGEPFGWRSIPPKLVVKSIEDTRKE